MSEKTFMKTILIGSITCLVIILVVGMIDNKHLHIDILETSCIKVCAKCGAYVISKDGKNDTDVTFIPCGFFPKLKYMIIKKDDDRFDDFKIKYMFIQTVSSSNKDFVKFYEFYKKNENTIFYKLQKSTKITIHVPEKNVTRTYLRPQPIFNGKRTTFIYIPQTVVEHKKAYSYDEIKYDDKYYDNSKDEPKLEGYKKVECNIFEYYKHVTKKSQN